MKFNAIVTIFIFSTVFLSGSSWMVQRVPIRPLSQTCHYYGAELRAEDKKLKKNLIVPDIEIPLDSFSGVFIDFLESLIESEKPDTKFILEAGKKGIIAGKLKSDPNALNNLYDVYKDVVLTNRAHLPSDYQPFGNGNNAEVLKQLLQHNPFFTSALQYKGGILSISSYAEKGESPTRYSKLITAYDENFPRVNVKINRNNFEVTTHKVFDSKGNDISSKYTKDEAIKILLFTLFYYAEVIHASIHIYDFINVLGISFAAEDSEGHLSTWARSYLHQVPLKYIEVSTALLNVGGALVGGGFKADRDKVLRYIVDDLLTTWLHYSTSDQFIDEFVFSYIPPIQRRGFLPEFLDQAKLVPSFTNDLTAAMKSANFHAYDKMNMRIEQYYREIGNDISNIKTVVPWLQLMSVINIVHASTFSFSRYIVTPQILPYLDISNKDAYTGVDARIAITILATTYGLKSDRYVFTPELIERINSLYPVLKKYADQSHAIKIKHLETIKADPKFAELGWIWTDFAPDLVDNKQLTLTTYV